MMMVMVVLMLSACTVIDFYGTFVAIEPPPDLMYTFPDLTLGSIFFIYLHFGW
jgi:hypothetical protein